MALKIKEIRYTEHPKRLEFSVTQMFRRRRNVYCICVSSIPCRPEN